MHKILKVEYIEDQSEVCDLSVEDNHNFYVCHSQEDIPLLVHNCGFFNLDENIEAKTKIGFRKGEMWSLERLVLELGMDHYNRTRLGKSDRTRLQTKPLEEVAEYGGVDVVLPIRVMRMQRALAKWRTEHMSGRPYARYAKNVVEVDGVKLQQFCFMERNGLKVDTDYVVSLRGTSSVFLKEVEKAETKFHSLPEVKKATQILQKQSNVRGGSLFGGKTKRLFDPKKKDHQQLFFFKVLGLPVLNIGKSNVPSIDKDFKALHADVPAVAAFADLEEALKLFSTYIKGWYEILRGGSKKIPAHIIADNRDGRLHTVFKYLSIITGRASSTMPNLQNVPERKSRSKIVKRQIISAMGRLILKRDFCLAEGTLISTERGLLPIEEIGRYIEHYGEIKATGMTGSTPIVDWVYNGRKTTFEVNTYHGNKINCTGDHQLIVLEEGKLVWKKAKECKIGDFLCINPNQVRKTTDLVLNLTKAFKNSNNTSGHTGVYLDSRAKTKGWLNTWMARVSIKNKYLVLGYFPTKEEAVDSRKKFLINFGLKDNKSLRNANRPVKMTPDLAYMLGCVIAEGYLSKGRHSTIHFSNSDKKLLKKYINCVYNVFGLKLNKELVLKKGDEKTINGVKTKATKNHYDTRLNSKEIQTWFQEMGIPLEYLGDKTNSHYKFIPWSILKADCESQAAFLAAYLECDGSVTKKHTLEWYSVSEKLIEQLQCMLLMFGGFPRVIHKKECNVKTLRLDVESSQLVWKYLKKYMSIKKLQDNASSRPKRRGIPISHWNQFVPTSNKIMLYSSKKTTNYQNLLKKKFPKVGEKLTDLIDLGLFYTQITSIKKGEIKKTYDLTVDRKHIPAFSANGLLVHNSAHEIRVWGISARDKMLAKTFWDGMKVRLQYIIEPLMDEAKKKEWAVKLKAFDVHNLNYGLLYSVDPAGVTKQQRNSVKAVIFGALYGKAIKTLGDDITNFIPKLVEALDKKIDELESFVYKMKRKKKV